MREFTVEITTFCPNECDYCSTNASKNGNHLEYEKIKQFLSDVSCCDRINISGGEPLAHPRFWDILQLCKSITPDVWVYTNALNQIRYNSDVIHEVTVEANVCLVPGKVAYIPQSASLVHLLHLIPQGRAKNMQPIKSHLSGCNCSYCDHLVLQADGQIVNGPCKKQYGGENDNG